MIVKELKARKTPDEILIEVLGKPGPAAVDALPLLRSYRKDKNSMCQRTLKRAIDRITPYAHEEKAGPAE